MYHGKVSVSVFYLWPLLHFVSVSGKKFFRQRQIGTLVIRMYMVLSLSEKTNFENFVSGKVYFLSVSFSHKLVIMRCFRNKSCIIYPHMAQIDTLCQLCDPLTIVSSTKRLDRPEAKTFKYGQT